MYYKAKKNVFCYSGEHGNLNVYECYGKIWQQFIKINEITTVAKKFFYYIFLYYTILNL